MPLIALVYVSFARDRRITDDELKAILTKAREKNQQRDITGMLLYRHDFFVQALEGEQTAVEELFKVIKEDPRHNHVLVLNKHEIEARSFKDWSMGFQIIDDKTIKSLEGFSDFVDKPFTMEFFENYPSHVNTLLNTFRRV